MSTRTAKNSTKVKLSEADKAADLDNYILNPVTNKHVLITSATGKKVVKARDSGETLKKSLTKVQFAIAIVRALMTHIPEQLTDDVVKSAIAEADIDLPRSFPKAWGGSGKQKSNSNRPKRALSGYSFFVKLVGPKLKEENPDENMMEMVAVAWKNITPAEKKKYEAMAAEDKIRNAKECEERGIAVSPTTKRPAKTNGWRIYSSETKQEMADQYPDDTKTEISKKVAAEWKSLTQEDKAEWATKAEVANEGFDDRLATWVKENPEAAKSKSPTMKIRPALTDLSDNERKKAEQPDTYIWNPESGRHVKLDSKKGKELAKNTGESDTEDEVVAQEVPEGDDEDLLIDE